MLGANYFGEGYFAEGPAVANQHFSKTLSSTIPLLASITSKLVHILMLSATIPLSATLSRSINFMLFASMTTIGILDSFLIKALDLKHAFTKMLTLANDDLPLQGPRSTTSLNLDKFTKDTTS